MLALGVHRQTGVSLIELLIGIAVLALLLGLAAPSLTQFIQNTNFRLLESRKRHERDFNAKETIRIQ